MQLSPREYFTIFRLLDDHTDTNRDSYFVRAVVRNARTSAVIATLDLESKGEGEYSKVWQVPADTSGEGFYIKMVTSVYTDSGYTTKSSNYGDEGTEFLVQDRQRVVGGGGNFIDYAAIKKTIKDEVASATTVSQATLGELKGLFADLETSLAHISTFLMANAGESGSSISSIADMLDQLKVVLSTKVDDVNKAVKGIVIPQPEHVDLDPLKGAIAKVNDTIERFNPDDLQKRSSDSFDRIKSFFTDDINKITGKIDEIGSQLSDINCLVLEPQGKKKKEPTKTGNNTSREPSQNSVGLPGRVVNPMSLK